MICACLSTKMDHICEEKATSNKLPNDFVSIFRSIHGKPAAYLTSSGFRFDLNESILFVCQHQALMVIHKHIEMSQTQW